MTTLRPTGDVFDDSEAYTHHIGTVTLFTERPATDKPIKREFPIGFHCCTRDTSKGEK